ncbi:uncharacterized protein METZ01_LOCUS504530, partial [marine metagenome]
RHDGGVVSIVAAWPKPAAVAGAGHLGGVLADRLRHYLCDAGFRIRPAARPAVAGHRLGAAKRANGSVPLAHDHARAAVDLRAAAQIQGRLSHRLADYYVLPRLRALDRPQAQPELDQHGVLQAQCRDQFGLFRCRGHRDSVPVLPPNL